jgi:23S rRNA pseudouridine2604 synthase
MARYIALDRLIALSLKCSKKEAKEIISNQFILVNELVVFNNQSIHPNDKVFYKDIEIQKGIPLQYFKYYKPIGIETTLNLNIEHNLKEQLKLEAHVFPIGRLDKHSEGLLLLTNDGALYNAIAHDKSSIEKEYIITLDQPITPQFLEQFANGVEIMGTKTLPCAIYAMNHFECKVILKEGKNRQIRRMCYKLGYQVINLKRTRIHNVQLKSMSIGELVELDKKELTELLKLKQGG